MLMPSCQLLVSEESDRLRIDMGLIALAVGVMAVAVALLSPSRTITFDPVARQVLMLRISILGIRWQSHYAFCDLGSVQVVREHSDVEHYYRVEIPCIVRREPIEIERFADESEANDAARRIAALTSRLVV